jgi:DNA-binding transcriptional regulator LsrR (DeoR family)
MDQRAQVHVDGFVTREELLEIMRLGAVGELTGWAFDAQGASSTAAQTSASPAFHRKSPPWP